MIDKETMKGVIVFAADVEIALEELSSSATRQVIPVNFGGRLL